jgi:hypothetical protein
MRVRTNRCERRQEMNEDEESSDCPEFINFATKSARIQIPITSPGNFFLRFQLQLWHRIEVDSHQDSEEEFSASKY